MKPLYSYLRSWWPANPNAGDYALAGAALMGAAGTVTGLIVGLTVYAPTAWFAAAELGLPATIFGAVAGSLVGASLAARKAIRRRTRR